MAVLNGLGLNSTISTTQTATAGLANNFDTFLTLLTEQLKNQDPLSPLDSTQFVDQLVQFSGVEQQINQNKNLESLINLNAANSATAAVGFIGKEVDVLNTTAPLANGNAQWSYATQSDAASVSILVKDANGKVVFKADGNTATGTHTFNWDGRDNVGTLLADGNYDLEVSALDNDGNLVSTSVTTTRVITGADFSGTEPALLVGNERIAFANILAVRERTAPAI
ncbi:MAG: flagellar hook assembly protein FlgD [Robiginitomaculum sp.]|nr:flagellar hook assembly protein FlgD [Robiginitomaculum sp.]